MEPLDTLDQEVADLVGNSDIEKPENQGDPAINVDVLSASMGERSTLATHSSGENRHSLHRSGENLATLPTDNVTASLRSEYAKYSPVPSRYSPNLDRSSWGPHKTLPVQASDLSNHSTSYNSHGVVPAGSNQNDEDSQCATPSSSSMAGETQKGSPVFRGQRSKDVTRETCDYYLPALQRSTSAYDLLGLKKPRLSDGKLFSPLMPDKNQSSKLSKRESLKVQKRHYRREKKRAAKELLHTLKDPSVIVMADWLKIRGTLKSWTKLWCVLKPGLLVLYKSQKQKSGHWVGTVLLNTCELIERPSKKDGFCFKLFHPLDQSIWATKGPKGENIGAITQPLPYSYLIFRALSEAAGKCWMDALELALRCSNLLMRTMTKDAKDTSVELEASIPEDTFLMSPLRQQMNDSDCERHFKGYGLEEDAKTDKEEEKEEKTESESEHSEEEEEKEVFDEDLQPLETPHIPNNEDFVLQGEASQTEEVAEENKSLIWALLKQVRPGMDLSKVVLPTFILEPRSFLDKLTDYYYHADLLSEAVAEEDPFSRMKGVVKWYLSGFYKKPKGPKKPYNPILGETFRCYWKHPKTGSRTFYIAEQISHHPPVSAFYVTNRQEGFSISGSILAKSKFYGNSLSAIMDGMGRLTFLKRGEDYLITIPYAHCKGVLIGTLIMELGGKVTIDCEKTGYSTELEFKLKPFLGGGEASNKITGKIKLGAETLAYIDGHWDGEVQLRDKITGESQMLWKACPEVRVKRLKRYTVALTHQADYESEKLWSHMTEALLKGDQDAATREKTVVEDEQRRMAKERKAKLEQWFPRYFERNSLTGDWLYKYADLRPWDPMNDLIHYEQDYVIQTKTRHRTPIVRTTSITNVDDPATRAQQRQSSMERARATRIKRAKHLRPTQRESGSSTPDAENRLLGDSESSDSMMGNESRHGRSSRLELAIVEKALEPLIRIQQHNTDTLGTIQNQLTFLARHTAMQENAAFFTNKDFFMIAMVLLIQTVFFWFLK